MTAQETSEAVLDESLPVLDPAPLMILAEDAGDTAAHRFFEEYLDLLPSRVWRVVCGLTDAEPADFLEAVVSLKVASAMAGAIRMEHYCRQLEDALADRALPDAAAVLEVMSTTSGLILHEGGRVQS